MPPLYSIECSGPGPECAGTGYLVCQRGKYSATMMRKDHRYLPTVSGITILVDLHANNFWCLLSDEVDIFNTEIERFPTKST